MKTKRVLICLYPLMLLLSSKAYGQWVNTGGPAPEEPAAFLSVAAKGDTLFAGSYANGGVYRSTDNGSTWAEILPQSNDNTISIQSGLLIVGSYDGIFISTDFGNTWTSGLGSSEVGGFGVLSVVTRGSLVVAGTDGGVYRSTDRGESWIKTWGSVITLAEKDSTLFAGTYDGIYRSTDFGLNWQPADSGLPAPNSYGYGPRVNAIEACDGLLFAGTNDSGVYKSTDDGSSWEPASSGLPHQAIYFLSAIGRSLYTCPNLDGTIYFSSDSGTSWHIVASNITDKAVFDLTGDGSHMLAATFAGVYTSSGADSVWKPVFTKIPSFMSVRAFYANGDNLIASGIVRSWNNAGFNTFSSTTMGRSWNPIDSVSPANAFNCFTAVGGIILGGTPRPIYSGGDQETLYRSTLGGTRWAGSATGIPHYSVNGIALYDGKLFAGTGDPPDRGQGPEPASIEDGGLYMSTDDGLTWSPDGFKGIDVYEIASGTDGILVATLSGVYLSTDEGVTWNAFNAGLPSYATLYSLSSGNSGFYAGGNGGIYELSTGSNVWNRLPAPSQIDSTSSAYGLQVLAYDNAIFAGTNTGVYMYYGSRWLNVGGGLVGGALYISSLSATNGILYAGTGSGVWMRPIQQLFAETDSAVSVPSNYSLYQNYPNPFNPTTTIPYSLLRNGLVKIQVFDVLGRLMQTLVNSEEQAGSYIVRFNGSRYASGVYFYRLTAPGVNIVRKMLLEK